MAFSAPRTWVVGELTTAALMNTEVRDNQSDLDARHDYGGPSLGAVPGRFYWTTVAGSGLAMTADELHYLPVWVPRPMSVDRIGAEVLIAAASSSLRLGLYADTGRFLPGALVAEAGTVPSATTGIKTVSFVPGVALDARTWWLAVVAQGGAPTLATATQADAYDLGTTSPDATESNPVYVQTGVTGALPASAGTLTTPNVGPAAFFVRVAP